MTTYQRTIESLSYHRYSLFFICVVPRIFLLKEDSWATYSIHKQMNRQSTLYFYYFISRNLFSNFFMIWLPRWDTFSIFIGKYIFSYTVGVQLLSIIRKAGTFISNNYSWRLSWLYFSHLEAFFEEYCLHLHSVLNSK